jgi:AraC family transcriptional regulator
MKHLQTGQFHEQTNKTSHLNGVTLTDTEYTLEKVDWHYHENAYFTFILQ